MLGDKSLWDETQTTQELMKCVTFSSLLFLFLYLYKKANFQGKGVWGKNYLKTTLICQLEGVWAWEICTFHYYVKHTCTCPKLYKIFVEIKLLLKIWSETFNGIMPFPF